MITNEPRAGDKITEKDMITMSFFLLMNELTRQVNLNTPIIATGSPDGVLTADKGQVYHDDTYTPGAFVYIKTTETGNAGWVLV
ncbi:hypothetical protein MNBD_GAMMA01-1329 [hydrothermal vent metagenome]|uniref:Uncharacterized protein n=1 Tax=hydrothermal vent metagenome TaxID=652676 RepID=A0A3B0V7T3_9ZZZZ